MDPVFLSMAVAVIAVIVVAVLLVRGERGRAEAAARMTLLGEAAQKLASAQDALSGRLQQGQENVNARLDGLTRRLGDSIGEQTEKTGESLRKLQERLAVIDAAQKNITDLSQQVVGLQDILANKQARGAFGESQLNDLVREILPPSAYAFQATLGNGRRADCLLKLPNPPGPIVIDAKFPLESYRALTGAGDDEARRVAGRSFGADISQHVSDIAERYIVAGETANSALMFLPSDSVYAELHTNFSQVVEQSYKKRVWIVSPTTLWATLNTVRAVLRDVRMREQAGAIQIEVEKMLVDVRRLDERVGKLQTHFGQAQKDVREILVSSEKVVKRGNQITEVRLTDDGAAEQVSSEPERVEGP